MWTWLCGIVFVGFVAFGWLIKLEMNIRGCGARHKKDRMEEGE